MSSHRPRGAWPALWKPLPARGRTPVPTAEVVAAGPLLLRLLAALDGTDPPCADHPEAWHPVTAAEAAPAIDACRRCPVLRECASYARALAPQHGVWGARDLTRRDGQGRAVPTTPTTGR